MKEEGKKKKDELKTEQWKKRERERQRTEDWISEGKKKKKKNGRPNHWKKKIPNPGEEMKKKKKRVKGQKLRLWVPPYVFNYKNAIDLWVMETENS